MVWLSSSNVCRIRLDLFLSYVFVQKCPTMSVRFGYGNSLPLAGVILAQDQATRSLRSHYSVAQRSWHNDFDDITSSSVSVPAS